MNTFEKQTNFVSQVLFAHKKLFNDTFDAIQADFSRTFYDGQCSLAILIDSNNQNTIFNENILIYSLSKILRKNRHSIIVTLNGNSKVRTLLSFVTAL